MNSALEDFCRKAGDDLFRKLFREVFLGGEDRITLLADWLDRLQDTSVEFAIITAGTSTAVLRALAVAVPEWLRFFPSDRIWDTSQGRHASKYAATQKVLI